MFPDEAFEEAVNFCKEPYSVTSSSPQRSHPQSSSHHFSSLSDEDKAVVSAVVEGKMHTTAIILQAKRVLIKQRDASTELLTF